MTKPPKRGRVSMSELMTPTSPLERQARPDAPYELVDEAADEWRAIVSSMPADYFMKANYPLLVQYCRHIVNARRLGQLIDRVTKAKKLDEGTYVRYLQLQNAESQAIQRLARSMRLTQQSVTRADASKKGRGVDTLIDAPWNRIGADEPSGEPAYSRDELGDDDE